MVCVCLSVNVFVYLSNHLSICLGTKFVSGLWTFSKNVLLSVTFSTLFQVQSERGCSWLLVWCMQGVDKSSWQEEEILGWWPAKPSRSGNFNIEINLTDNRVKFSECFAKSASLVASDFDFPLSVCLSLRLSLSLSLSPPPPPPPPPTSTPRPPPFSAMCILSFYPDICSAENEFWFGNRFVSVSVLRCTIF